MSRQPELQENGVEGQRNRSGSGIPVTTAPASGSTQGTANHTPQVETFSIPARGPDRDNDHDHRTTITIESQRRQWPQDIWFHSPWQRVLYQPALMYPLQPEEQPGEQPMSAEATKTDTNGDTKKSSST
ncbi:hypothetical protein FHETE_9097 [Fusarium heterosporum]|uniref:Uncharacterized protein n=1 Tax=Fusarium heterosporum TaxID=42747 RepID=A0A8H5WIV2_FUSHE|nr:hypothetical protein FHETE_9097 [Fusarium heterosporum]